MITAHYLTGEFLDDLRDQIELDGLLGVRPECFFYIRPEDETTYLEVFFLKEKWTYEIGPARCALKRIPDLAGRVGRDLKKWINKRVYGSKQIN